MSHLSYISSPHSNHQQNKSIVDVLVERRNAAPDKEICIHRLPGGGRKSLTYSELTQKSAKVAKYLISKGVCVGDNVAIIGSNSLEWIIGAFAVFTAGAVAVQFQSSSEVFSETVRLLKYVQCKAVLLDPLTDTQYLSEMEGYFQSEKKQSNTDDTPALLLLQKPVGIQLPYIGDVLSAEKEPTIPLPTVQPQHSAAVFFTSGSTGVPKMANFTHLAITNSPIPNFSNENDIFFSDKPFFWLGGTPIYTILRNYPRIFTDPKMVVEDEQIKNVWEILKEEKCTVASLFPCALVDLLKNQDEILKIDYKLKSIRTGGHLTGGHLSVFRGPFCEDIYSVYGSTETGMVAKISLTAETEIGEVGELLPGYEAKVIGDDDQTLVRGKIGDIVLRSPWMLKSYTNSPELNRHSFSDEGWFRIGDIGLITEDGKLYVKGKVQDVVTRGTAKILSKMVETKITSFPGVKEAAVIAVPDTRHFEEVCACVIMENDNITKNDLRKMCMDTLGDNIIGDSPTYYLMFKYFPRLDNGKIDRVQTKLQAMEMLNLG